MAKNLRAKMPKEDTLVINDRNTETTAKFVEELGEGVEIAKSPREVAEKSVCRSSNFPQKPTSSHDEHVLSMI